MHEKAGDDDVDLHDAAEVAAQLKELLQALRSIEHNLQAVADCAKEQDQRDALEALDVRQGP